MSSPNSPSDIQNNHNNTSTTDDHHTVNNNNNNNEGMSGGDHVIDIAHTSSQQQQQEPPADQQQQQQHPLESSSSHPSHHHHQHNINSINSHTSNNPLLRSIVNWEDLQRELSIMIQEHTPSHHHHHPHLPVHHPSVLSSAFPVRYATDLHHVSANNSGDGSNQHHHQDSSANNTVNTAPVIISSSSSSSNDDAAVATAAVQQSSTNDQNNNGDATATTTTTAENLSSATQNISEQLGFQNGREVIDFLFKAVPLVLLPGLLFLYFHFIGVLTFLWLFLAIFTVHERLKQQVSLKENRSIWMSALLILICASHISLLYFFWNRYKPWWFLIFRGSLDQKLDFWDSLFFVVITDCVLKLSSMAIKSAAVLLLGSLTFIKSVIKGRIYANIETIFYAYRCCLPVAVWVRYLWNPEIYPMAFAIFVIIVYAVFKLRSIALSIWKCFTALRILFSSTAPFGRYATREEILEADDSCSVCQDDFQRPIMLDCGHMFCEECISSWFARENTCPICRAKQENVNMKFTDGSSNLGIFAL